ncbi:nitric oxide synthase isoform X1 [Brevipalpus obovatus]|uniref:nitric oxide synthase isoform X1 n=1 Tax=Brevipalpus obovatus TaxID=246614 RepID=UPI003D9DB3F4
MQTYRNPTQTIMMASCPVSNNSVKAVKLSNLLNGHVGVDTLHQASIQKVPCDDRQCLGSLMKPPSSSSKHHRTKEDILFQAEHFFTQYFASIKRLNTTTHEKRLAQVRNAIERQSTYTLKETELIFGAKLAWRNAPRCIGRIQWSKLQVFDARYVTSAKDMFDALCNHIKYATNKGNLRSAITIFPQRTTEDGEFRIWNQQLISYAGYQDPENPGHIIGDPINIEFTQLCIKLGWKPERTPFDVLPIVVSAAGQDPQLFPIPEELILRVPLEHPKYEWFKDLGLQWYALPAVSSMMLDLGGIEFPACPFSGWYMVTEIACRDLCDVNRYNILEKVALKMGLNTRSNMTLWRDEALVEVNKAVIESFHKLGVTIVDHHTAAESFMKHLENEQRLRGGCPADWVWIVPPTSGSLTPVFHQEMINYNLKPSFEYQEPAWKSHQWHSSPNSDKLAVSQARKKRFKEIARAVKFTSNLFGKALAKRVKATILYATETGRSEEYAKRLEQIFSYAFNVTLMCMDSYDTFQLEHEALLLIVTSTFGNGDPPENGESFARQLQAIKVTGDTTPDLESIKSVSTTYLGLETTDALGRNGDLSSNVAIISHIGPLSNIRFTVFGLGSSAYPNFCQFGKYLDNVLGELGGERIHRLGTGDELCGQEQSFNQWSKDVFARACEVFCIWDEINLNDVMKTAVMKPKSWSIQNCKLVPLPSQIKKPADIVRALNKCSNRKVIPFRLLSSVPLHKGGENERQTIRVILEQEDCGKEIASETLLKYQPGDHLGIFPENCPKLVQSLMKRLFYLDFTTVYQVLIRKVVEDSNGEEMEWVPHEKLAPCSVEEALIRYLDITTPPTQQLLNLLAAFCSDEEQKSFIQKLSSDTERYEEWKSHKYPNFYELLMEFDSLKPPAEVLFTQLPILQPRFYSISSSDAYYEWLATPFINGGTDSLRKNKVRSENIDICNDADGHHHHGIPNIFSISSKTSSSLLSSLSTSTSIHQHTANHPPPSSPSSSSVSSSPLKSKFSSSLLSITSSSFDPLSWFTTSGGVSKVIGINKRPDRVAMSNNNASSNTNNNNNNNNNNTNNNHHHTNEKENHQDSSNNKDDNRRSLVNGRFSVGNGRLSSDSGSNDSGLDARLMTIHAGDGKYSSTSCSSSSSSSKNLLKVDLTVAVVRYKTQSGNQHYGVCSNFLADICPGHEVYGFLRSAPNFRMPEDLSTPMIMVGPGTGIAPFRAFWLQRYAYSLLNPHEKSKFGPMSLFFGCRTPSMELYSDETHVMLKEGVLSSIQVALSRVNGQPKRYVQDLLRTASDKVYDQLIHQNGHFYVCGDVSMAEGVCQTLKNILADHGYDDPDSLVMTLRREGRYHEDIFGITLRTDEVRRKTRSEALTRKK